VQQARIGPLEHSLEDFREERRTRQALLHMLEDLQREREQIRNARREWVETVDSVEDPIMVHDAQFLVTRCNRAYAERAGMSFAEIIGKPYWQCFPKGAGPLPGCHGTACGTLPDQGGRLAQEEFALDSGEIFVSRAFPVHSGGGHFLHLFEEMSVRRRAEEKLRMATLVVENSPSVLFRCSPAAGWPIQYVSSNVSLWGYDAARMTAEATPLAGLAHPDDVEPLREALERHSVRNLERFNLEFRIRTQRGETRWLECRGYIGRDAGGRVLYYQGIATDITERKKAAEALERRERYFHKLIEGSSDAFFVVDRAGKMLYRSESGERLTGYPGSEVAGRELLMFVAPESRAQAASGLAQAIADPREPVRVEVRVARKDGRTIEVEAVGRNLLDDPDVGGVVVTARDVSERRRAEQSLRASEERYRAMFDQAAIGITQTALDGTLLKVNPAFCSMLGYTAPELEGRSFLDFTHPGDKVDSVGLKDVLLAGARAGGSAEKRYLRKDGSETWAQVSVGLVRARDGSPDYFVTMVQDINKRKQAVATLRESDQRLDLAKQSARIGIWDWDVQANSLVWDERMYALYGIRAEDFSGAYDAWQAGLHPDDRAPGDAAIQAALRGEKDFDIEFRVRWPNGEVHHIEAHALVQRAADGTPTRMIGVNWDITERKRAEERQQFTNAVLATQQETSLDGIYVVDDNRRMVSCNRRFVEMWGVPEEVMQTRSDELAIQAVLGNFESPGEFLDGVQRLFENHEQQLHDELRLKDGRTFERYSSPMTGADGRYFGRVFYFRDITESQAAQRAVRESEEKFRAIFDHTVDGIAVFDLDTRRVRFANGSMERLLGYAPGELAEIALERLLPADSAETSLRGFARAAAGQTTGAPNIPLQTKTGGQVFVDIKGSRVQIADRTYLLGAFRDATERRAGEGKLHRLNRALKTLSAGNEALVRAKDETSLLHEMTRILAEVGGYAIAFVAYANDDAARSVTLEASAGIEAAALARLAISWGDNDHGQSAVARAMRLGKTQIGHDPQADAGYLPWREILRTHSITASLGLPLSVAGGRPIGAIGIATASTDAFDADELKLLEELAGDLGYGIANLRAREARQSADEQIRVLARFPEENPNAVLRLDDRGVLLYANPASRAFLQACGGRVGEPAGGRCYALAREAYSLGGLHDEEMTLGDSVYAVTFAPVPEARYVNVYAVDITARRRAEATLHGALVATVDAIAATVDMRDPYTAGHQRRVAELAGAIAVEMGLRTDQVEGIRFGALIHDLGKVQVPAELLSKPTRLTKLELELIKTHPQAGYDIVKGIQFPWPVAQMVHQHHERLDGSGYPQGLKGDAIALEARVLAVADVVEAMASHRPYRPGLGVDAALREIEDKRGRAFDPQVVDACLRLFREQRFAFAAP
jgi:PAS domain S-box-containing protein/putative nucleotidyltransferase with HDIG domain